MNEPQLSYDALFFQLSAMNAKDLLPLRFENWQMAAEVVHEYNEKSKQHRCALVYGRKDFISIIKDSTISLKDYLNLHYLRPQKIKSIKDK